MTSGNQQLVHTTNKQVRIFQRAAFCQQRLIQQQFYPLAEAALHLQYLPHVSPVRDPGSVRRCISLLALSGPPQRTVSPSECPFRPRRSKRSLAYRSDGECRRTSFTRSPSRAFTRSMNGVSAFSASFALSSTSSASFSSDSSTLDTDWNGLPSNSVR